jgi:hypothetical protein
LSAFLGTTKEALSHFIEPINCAYQKERARCDSETAPIAKRSLLVEGCKGKAVRFIKDLVQEKKDIWEHLVEAVPER